MSDNETTTTRKPRVTKERVFRVEDPNSGFGGFYRALSTTQARAFHVEPITAREATIEELIAIGRDGTAIGGIGAVDEDDGQDALPLGTTTAPGYDSTR